MIRTYADSGALIAGSRLVGVPRDAARAVLFDPKREFLSSVFVRLEELPKAV